MAKEKKLLECICPVCGYKCNRHFCFAEQKDIIPNIGDATICINCASYLEYDENLLLKKMDIEKFDHEILQELDAIYYALLKAKKSQKENYRS